MIIQIFEDSASSYLLPSTYYLSSYYLLPTTYYLLPTTYNLLLPTYDLLHAKRRKGKDFGIGNSTFRILCWDNVLRYN